MIGKPKRGKKGKATDKALPLRLSKSRIPMKVTSLQMRKLPFFPLAANKRRGA
jgi:hypothetical protein